MRGAGNPSRANQRRTSAGVRHASAPCSRLVVLQNRRTTSSDPAVPNWSGQLPSGSGRPLESVGWRERFTVTSVAIMLVTW